jgi:hypothetical protein
MFVQLCVSKPVRAAHSRGAASAGRLGPSAPGTRLPSIQRLGGDYR